MIDLLPFRFYQNITIEKYVEILQIPSQELPEFKEKINKFKSQLIDSENINIREFMKKLTEKFPVVN